MQVRVIRHILRTYAAKLAQLHRSPQTQPLCAGYFVDDLSRRRHLDTASKLLLYLMRDLIERGGGPADNPEIIFELPEPAVRRWCHCACLRAIVAVSWANDPYRTATRLSLCRSTGTSSTGRRMDL